MKKYTAFVVFLIIILSNNILFAQEEDNVPYLSDADIAALEAVLLEDVPADLALSDYTGTPPEKILSRGALPREVLIDFLLRHNPALERRRAWAENLIDRYILEAGREGVNYEIAFAQMCYHTNYLKFGTSFVNLEMNNFCGLITSPSNRRAYKFNTLWEGVGAHIQHLKGYATDEPPTSRLVDPRYWAIEEKFGFGSAPALSDLDGKWAGPGYVINISRILNALYDN
jgi:hypothetical protein